MDSFEPGAHRPSVKSWCQHINILSPALCWEEIRRRVADKPECDTCLLTGKNLWLCLARGCSNVGCGFSAKKHDQIHGKEFRHHLAINLTTFRLWCFACESEVFPGHNNPPLNIPEVVSASSLKEMAHCESSNSSPQRSSSGADDTDSDLDDENSRPRGLTGLQNLGNTCYLNSAVQALSNCPPLTRFFLDCQGSIRPDRSPMLSKSYAKLISELWHKKRLSYVVPSGIVNGIKIVHPMFRGYTQQDAQEFLRCFMDQLHEELKYPIITSDDEEDDNVEQDNDDEDREPESGIASPTDPSAQSLAGSLGGGGDSRPLQAHHRQNSVDSSSSECEYETCDSGLSSEMGSQADPSISSDDNSEINEHTVCLPATQDNRDEKTVGGTSPQRLSPASQRRQNKNHNSYSSGGMDTVANLKEIKETANLLSKIETDNARNQSLQKSESGEYLDALSDSAPAANTRSRTAAQQQQQHQQQQHQQQQQQQRQQSYQDVAGSRAAASVKTGPLPQKAMFAGRRRRNIQYESVISHVFDGKILSSVQCLYCDRVSTTKETFQDLSLPIPSKDSLQVLHSGHPSVAPGGGGAMGGPRGGACGDQMGTQSWFSWMFSWMKSWTDFSFFVGPTITLRDCLSAFFSADELKGDNMYSCEQCKKLRNGLKYSKVLELPEVLCIHLKRFRHEFFSSKINTYISFPLHKLDMKPYLHKDCKSEVMLYDLVGVVCHHGTAGGGHYTAYCLNKSNDQWYEYDDMYVTEVDVSQVINSEAYVLFYRKSDEHMHNLRMKAMKLKDVSQPSLMQFYVSKQWINRFNTFAEPGPISNRDFLCKHGGVAPHNVNHVNQLVHVVEQNVWELLYTRFGGGPVCNRLYHCQVCQEELDMVKARQKWELESFVTLNNEFVSGEVHYPAIYGLSMAWFREWEAFVKTKTDNVFLLSAPGPIDNSRIVIHRNGQHYLRPTADYGQVSPDMWHFLHRIYGGGPEAIIRQRTTSASQSSTTVSSSSSPPSASKGDTGTTASSSATSTTSPNTSSPSPSPSPVPSPPVQTSAVVNTRQSGERTSSSGGPQETVSAQAPGAEDSAGSHTPSTRNNSSSSSSTSTLTPSESRPKMEQGLVPEMHRAPECSAVSDTPPSSDKSSKRVSHRSPQASPVLQRASKSTSRLDTSSSLPNVSPPPSPVSNRSLKSSPVLDRSPQPSPVSDRPSAVCDSGESGEEEGCGSKSGSCGGVSTMQEIKGIPQPMDVTRL